MPSNDISTNPMILEVEGATVLWPTKLKVKHFAFSNYSAQGSSVIVQGIDGKVKFSATGETDLSPVSSHSVGWINGLVLSTLDDGQLAVYLD